MTRVANVERGLATHGGWGDYQAKGDLIFVYWNDGRRTNLRWRLRGNMLLVTDHTGRTTRWMRHIEQSVDAVEQLPNP